MDGENERNKQKSISNTKAESPEIKIKHSILYYFIF